MTKEQLNDILENSLKKCNADVQSDNNVLYSAPIIAEECNDMPS
ncbi:BolA family transcriptional regulator, partial [Francisella tularensis subsp. holarctica]|nr:BolA family transcriptional regulator [Francisella tularensis subsp. holarctica]